MTDAHFAKLKTEYENLGQELAQTTEPAKIRKLTRRHIELGKILAKAEEFKKLKAELSQNQELLESPDEELKKMAQEEIDKLQNLVPKVQEELKRLLVPRDPADAGDAILEIRAGTGGDEAAIFAAELLRLYTRFAEKNNFKTGLDGVSRSDLGGIKEAILEVRGDGAYGALKYEGGVHRVQRVPETEKSGRVHTSTASVAVLPLLEEADFELNPKDVKFEATTSSGHGGQSVNTTYSAVRLVHIPTGITAQCQDERSQAQNKIKAMNVLRSRVAAQLAEQKDKELRAKRQGQIKGGERSDKIRTYNFPQDRITDHRLNENFSQIENRMDGDIADIIEQLKALDEKEKLEALEV
jgi:peptide chain release factor 1